MSLTRRPSLTTCAALIGATAILTGCAAADLHRPLVVSDVPKAGPSFDATWRFYGGDRGDLADSMSAAHFARSYYVLESYNDVAPYWPFSTLSNFNVSFAEFKEYNIEIGLYINI